MPAWPASIPQAPLVDQWVGGPQRNKVSFQPDVGPSIDRRRTSAAHSIFQGTFGPFTDAQLASFESFFSTDLADGTLSFTWDDPVTGVSYNWKFTDDEPPYQITHSEGNLHTIAMRLMRLGAA